MKKQAITAVLILSFITIASAVYSQTATPAVTHRQVRQQKRIANGVKEGELTATETAKLETREAKIQHDKKVAKSDGVVTAKERRKFRREEKRASRAIRRQKHDAQQRP